MEESHPENTLIVFIDDESSLLELYCNIMKRVGTYKFMVFINHQELMDSLGKILEERKYTKIILFSDRQMPGISGYEVVNQVRAMCSLHNVES